MKKPDGLTCLNLMRIFVCLQEFILSARHACIRTMPGQDKEEMSVKRQP